MNFEFKQQTNGEDGTIEKKKDNDRWQLKNPGRPTNECQIVPYSSKPQMISKYINVPRLIYFV